MYMNVWPKEDVSNSHPPKRTMCACTSERKGVLKRGASLSPRQRGGERDAELLLVNHALDAAEKPPYSPNVEFVSLALDGFQEAVDHGIHVSLLHARA